MARGRLTNQAARLRELRRAAEVAQMVARSCNSRLSLTMRPYRSTSLPMLRIISLCACLITVSALFLPDWLPESRRTFEQSIRHRLAAALETEHDSWAYARPWRQSHHEATEDEMEERTAGFVDQRHRPIVFAAPSMQKRKVNITLGVMASCPDAELCEQIFVHSPIRTPRS